jgi:hypothetical protein
MAEILNIQIVNDLLTSLLAGDLNTITIFLWVLVATVLSLIGGAIGGMLLASKDIGYQLSAILGALFAPAGVIPAILVGLAVLNFLANY